MHGVFIFIHGGVWFGLLACFAPYVPVTVAILMLCLVDNFHLLHKNLRLTKVPTPILQIFPLHLLPLHTILTTPNRSLLNSEAQKVRKLGLKPSRNGLSKLPVPLVFLDFTGLVCLNSCFA